MIRVYQANICAIIVILTSITGWSAYYFVGVGVGVGVVSVFGL